MNIEELTIWLSKNGPTEDIVREFAVDNLHEYKNHLRCLYAISEITQGGKFQGIQKLKLLLICYNLVQELSILDRILGITRYQQTPYYYAMLSKKITQVFKRVSTADKYKKYDHVLNITYEAVEK